MCHPFGRIVLAGCAIVAASLAPLLAGGAAGRAAESTSRSVGAWDLKVQGNERQCRVTLRPQVAPAGYAVAMPVGCHRAFPVLGAVAVWTDTGDGKLQLEDAAGQPVLAFEPGPDGVLTSTSPEGEIYRLEAAGPHREMVLPALQGASAPPAPETEVAAAQPVARLQAPKSSEMAGYFSVLRDKTKDTGCMITFDDKIHGPKTSFKAHLAPACRDQGIVIFDPIGWQLAAGRLVLTARKGHTATFDLQADGSWLKDPSDGKTMSLKKM